MVIALDLVSAVVEVLISENPVVGDRQLVQEHCYLNRTGKNLSLEVRSLARRSWNELPARSSVKCNHAKSPEVLVWGTSGGLEI